MRPQNTALDRVRAALERHGSRITADRGDRFQAQCPAHDDKAPSLSVRHSNDRALLYCHAGCDRIDVLSALALNDADLFDHDAPRVTGKVRHEYVYAPTATVLRLDDPKSFRPMTVNGDGQWSLESSDTLKRTPYRLPKVVAAVANGETVYIVEGEKDADRLTREGLTATCNAGGAGKWTADHAYWLKGADVVIVRDNDEAGRKHVDKVVQTLSNVANSIRVMLPGVGKDVSDHLDSGRGLAELIDETGEYDKPIVARRVVSRPVSDIQPKRRQWLWRDRIPLGELTLFAGHGGIGKSQAAVWLSAQVSRGAMEGELQGQPVPVLYQTTEDSWEYTVSGRLRVADADLSLVRELSVKTETGDNGIVLLSVDLESLRDEVVRTGARVIILDALLSAMAGTGRDLFKQGVVRGLLEPVSRLAQDLNLAIIGVCHFRKEVTSDVLLAISGSVEFGQVVRSAMGFARDPEADDGSCLMSQIKTNIARQGVPSIRYRIDSASVETDDGPSDVGKLVILGETDVHVRDFINPSPRSDNRVDACVKWLLTYLEENGEGVERKQIIAAGEEIGFSQRTLYRAKDKANVGDVSMPTFPRTVIWTAPLTLVTTPGRTDTTVTTATTGTTGTTGSAPVMPTDPGTTGTTIVTSENAPNTAPVVPVVPVVPVRLPWLEGGDACCCSCGCSNTVAHWGTVCTRCKDSCEENGK